MGFFNWFIFFRWAFSYYLVTALAGSGSLGQYTGVFLIHMAGGLVGAIAYHNLAAQFKNGTFSSQKADEALCFNGSGIALLVFGGYFLYVCFNVRF